MPSGSSAGPHLDVTFKAPSEGTASAAKKKDPWNYWTFRIGGNGNRNGEKSSNSSSTSINFSGNRTTDQWKIRVSGNRRVSTSTFILDDDTTIKSTSHSWDMGGMIVKSLGPRWAIGGLSNASHSSFSNTDRSYTASFGLKTISSPTRTRRVACSRCSTRRAPYKQVRQSDGVRQGAGDGAAALPERDSQSPPAVGSLNIFSFFTQH